MSCIAIVSAMREELHALLPLVHAGRRHSRGGREFHVGQIGSQPVVLVLSGIGKVAAATTTTLLLDAFSVQRIVFTGVAGGLGDDVRVGDVVLAEQLLQHDMDASPLFPRYEIPLTGRSRIAGDAMLNAVLADAAALALGELRQGMARFGAAAPRLHRGLVVSGDRFVSTSLESAALRAALPDALAVEMEGAAVAQVCADFGVPFAVVRTVSDRADDSAHVDFNRFLAEVASEMTRAIVQHALARLGEPSHP
jgi:adenosylhomocysteine nucleosidase